LNQAALKLSAARQFDRAIENLEQACELAPDNKTIKTNLVMVMNACAVNAANLKNYQLASEMYEKAVAHEEASYIVHSNYGNFLFDRGRLDEAASSLEKALNSPSMKKADEYAIRFTLGGVYMKKGFYDEAINAMEAAATEGKHAGALFLMGKICYTQGKFQNAIEYLEEAVRSGKGEYASAAAELLKKVKKEGKVESKFESQTLYHFQVQFDGDKKNDVKVDRVMQLLEEAYNTVGSYFNYYPEVPTPVIIYSQNQFKEASGSPVWVAALYDGKIRLPLNDVAQNADNLKQLILHEYTHAVIFHVARGRCPVWLNEGFAQILEGESLTDVQKANIKKYIDKKQAFDMKGLEGSFMGISPHAAVELAYNQSLSFTNFVIEKAGQSQLIDSLQLLGEGKSMSEILKENFYTEYKKLQEEWVEQINR